MSKLPYKCTLVERNMKKKKNSRKLQMFSTGEELRCGHVIIWKGAFFPAKPPGNGFIGLQRKQSASCQVGESGSNTAKFKQNKTKKRAERE